MFWVLGGVSKVFSKINTYKTFFSEIKNEKTLWEKSYLIIDKDNLTDKHSKEISNKIKETLNLSNFIFPSYTIESILFKDISKLSELLVLKYQNEEINLDIEIIKEKLTISYTNYKDVLIEKYQDDKVSNPRGFPSYKDYRGRYINTTKLMFNQDKPLFEIEEWRMDFYRSASLMA
jgi:hypothetical protein